MKKHTLLLLSCLALASPAGAQDPPALSIRPFIMGAEQTFTPSDTFDTVFETTRGPFFGGGVQVVIADQFVIEAGASRFKQDGERVFRTNAGSIFRLGIPLTATIVPFELTGDPVVSGPASGRPRRLLRGGPRARAARRPLRRALRGRRRGLRVVLVQGDVRVR